MALYTISRTFKLLKLTVFCCHAEPKAKHLALTAENGISSWARFFASLRCAQNDTLLYVLVNKRITTIDAIESVSLSKIAFSTAPSVQFTLSKVERAQWPAGAYLV